MAEAQILADRLAACQNPDGGWPYGRGSSWAEPTAFAVLALQETQFPAISPVLKRALAWLLHAQTPSGGWTPTLRVPECTSVTSVATLALLGFSTGIPAAQLDSAISATAQQVYTDDLSLSLLLAKAFHLPPPRAPGSVPWYPGTAGWITPTALTALALFSAAQRKDRPDLHSIAIRACNYLVSRRCVDGGWNHGGTSARSEDAVSYPETTGLALLALRTGGVTPPPEAVSLAREFAAQPASTEGLAWLQLALGTSSKPVPDPEAMPTPRTIRDLALRLMAVSAQSGTSVLWREST
jgi:hypothetical protein